MSICLTVRSLGRLLLATGAIAAAAASVTRAQEEEVSPQLWLDYDPRWTWPSGFEVYGDVGLRTELLKNGWGRIVVRPGVRGTLGSFRLSGGVGSFYTRNDDAANR